MLEDVAPPPQEWLGTPTMSMSPGSRQILAICSSLALGCTCRRLARNGGVGSYTPALGSGRRCWSYALEFGSKCRCWVVHAGVGLKTEVLGHTRWCWVVHAGVGFETSVLVVDAGVRLKTSVLVRRPWRWVVHTGVGLKTDVLGHMRWCWVIHAGVGLETSVLVVHVSFLGYPYPLGVEQARMGSRRVGYMPPHVDFGMEKR